MRELEAERDMSPMPPVITGGCLVIPARVVVPAARPAEPPRSTKEMEALAMAAVMEFELANGRNPIDVSAQNRGWDVESVGADGRIRFIEVKGRRPDATTVCVTRNEWLTAMNKRGDFYLAVVIVDNGYAREPMMFADPLKGDVRFGVTSVNLDLRELAGAKE